MEAYWRWDCLHSSVFRLLSIIIYVCHNNQESGLILVCGFDDTGAL